MMNVECLEFHSQYAFLFLSLLLHRSGSPTLAEFAALS